MGPASTITKGLAGALVWALEVLRSGMPAIGGVSPFDGNGFSEGPCKPLAPVVKLSCQDEVSRR
ncbi:hypothetical protein [Prochlorococcus marinus]|uniref:hypothetical protein n=1 Tax=Prochlorococcus marinus TaxID=1219 RepID=UPI001F337D43|nr:hypothetical protein [Prochlorococcus marinus]